MSPEQEDVDDAIAAAARNTDEADARHAGQQRAYLLDLASGDDGDRWQHGASDAGFRIRSEYAVASIGDDLGAGVDATVWTDWSQGDIRLSVEHDEADRHASLGMTLSAEAAEGLALDLLELAQEQREAREPDD
jgi:hypothetical protein